MYWLEASRQGIGGKATAVRRGRGCGEASLGGGEAHGGKAAQQESGSGGELRVRDTKGISRGKITQTCRKYWAATDYTSSEDSVIGRRLLRDWSSYAEADDWWAGLPVANIEAGSGSGSSASSCPPSIHISLCSKVAGGEEAFTVPSGISP